MAHADPRRANVVSSFTIVKGAMIEESYAVLRSWDFRLTKAENLRRACEHNVVGARSATWLRDVAKVLNRRLDPSGRDRPLTVLARGGCGLDVWKPLLLWHITRDEFLLRDFLVGWLFPAFDGGTYRVRASDLEDFVRGVAGRGGEVEHAWSPTTLARVTVGLLKIATDFGLLRGSVDRQFCSYHLPDESLLYLLHAIRDVQGSPRRTIDAQDWRMFLLAPGDVERELLRLHQYRRLDYQAAGSLAELRLPCTSALEFAERFAA